MGHSSYSDDLYRHKSAIRSDTAAKTGRTVADATFAYTADTRSKPIHDWKASGRLNPMGLKVREARDSDAHPETLAIGVLCDVTGSMGGIPRVMQEKLPLLMGLLMRKGYVEHPAILFGGIGDAYCDRVPLQIGQFESGLEMDDDLTELFLEGGGGGSIQESYELGLYVFAHHTSIDCWEKRGKKGYLFTIGDETPYDFVSKGHVKGLIGADLQADIPTKELVATLGERYHVFHILPDAASHGGDTHIKGIWQKLLGGQHVLHLEDASAVSEVIALAIGISEGKLESDDMATHLKDAGASDAAVSAATKALAPLAKASKGVVAAKATGKLPDVPGDAGSTRL